MPVLVPLPSGQTYRPWLTPAMFRGYPHWLDLDDLIQGGPEAVQDDSLADNLLAATDWAVGELGQMRLDGHLVSGEQRHLWARPSGLVELSPYDVPLRGIVSLSYGSSLAGLAPLTLPYPSMQVVNGGWGVEFITPSCRELYVNWTYVAGYPVALLPSGVTAGATTLTVDNPAGILPGDVLRCYDPGITENFTVASSYVPDVPTWPPTATSIPLAAAVKNTHLAGTGVTAMPRRALQAVIAYTVALLMREDVSSEEPVSGFGPEARTTAGARGGLASGLVNDAYGWLNAFRPPLRGG